MIKEDENLKIAVFKRLLEALHGRRIKIPDFQKEYKIDSQKWNNWRIRGLPPKENSVMAERVGVNLNWLTTGKGECFSSEPITDKNARLSVTLPIEKPPITTTFDVPTNIKLEICKNMTPSTIEMAYNTKSNNLVTAIYRLMNISKEQDRLKVLLEIDDLIQAEIDMEKYVLEPAAPKPKIPA